VNEDRRHTKDERLRQAIGVVQVADPVHSLRGTVSTAGLRKQISRVFGKDILGKRPTICKKREKKFDTAVHRNVDRLELVTCRLVANKPFR
jgi:hypothetical protein